jgi:hypothetical protein
MNLSVFSGSRHDQKDYKSAETMRLIWFWQSQKMEA